MRAAATARKEGWERERRAKMHHVRSASRFYCVYCTWGGGSNELSSSVSREVIR